MTAIVIEKELVGGDCPFWACVPSKTLLRPQQALEEAKAVTGVKEKLLGGEDTKLDAGKVFARRDVFTSRWDDADRLVPLVESSGTVLIRGTGKIVGIKKVAVENPNGDKVELDARLAVAVCTGSEPIVPDIPGLAETDPWTPRHAVSSSVVPEHLIILGAGPVACELVTAYRSFGAKVTLLTHSAEILTAVDPEAGKLVRKSMVAKGVDVRINTDMANVSKGPDGTITVELSTGESIKGTKILLGVGRRPATSGIGLEQFGLKTDGSPIPVDETLLVDSVPGGWLYAAGDVNGRAPLTHSCKYHGRVASNAIIARAKGESITPTKWDSISATADRYALPQVIFTSPEVTSVGLTRTKAETLGRTVREITAPVASAGARIWAEGYSDGWAQWIVDEKSGKLLGATMVGEGVSELLHASTVAIVGGLTLSQLAHSIPCFPTMSEVYLNLLDAAGF